MPGVQTLRGFFPNLMSIAIELKPASAVGFQHCRSDSAHRGMSLHEAREAPCSVHALQLT